MVLTFVFISISFGNDICGFHLVYLVVVYFISVDEDVFSQF